MSDDTTYKVFVIPLRQGERVFVGKFQAQDGQAAIEQAEQSYWYVLPENADWWAEPDWQKSSAG